MNRFVLQADQQCSAKKTLEHHLVPSKAPCSRLQGVAVEQVLPAVLVLTPAQLCCHVSIRQIADLAGLKGRSDPGTLAPGTYTALRLGYFG